MNRIISEPNLTTGEITTAYISKDVPIEFNFDRDARFIVKGYKMYQQGVELLLTVLTNSEALRITRIYNGNDVDYNNILTKPFRDLTADMKPNKRSAFKHKLLSTGIISEYNKKIFINPFVFVPRKDRNVKNSQYLTQRLWKYIVEDVDSADAAVVELSYEIFGRPKDNKDMLVGIGKRDKSSDQKKWIKGKDS